MSCGTPQGSVLGPLLFLIYMNDIRNASELLSSVLFADDSTFLNSINATLSSSINKHECESTINIELKKIHDWLAVNKLSLNVKKTKFMIFHTRNKNVSSYSPKILIAGIEIERVQIFDFL